MVNGSFNDLGLIDSTCLFLRWKKRKKIPLQSRMHKRCLYGCSILSFSPCLLFFIPSLCPIMRDRGIVHYVISSGLWSINLLVLFMRHPQENLSWKRKNYWNSAKPSQGLCTKNGQSFMGCIRRHGKGCFYVSNRSPRLWHCWSCSDRKYRGFRINLWFHFES